VKRGNNYIIFGDKQIAMIGKERIVRYR